MNPITLLQLRDVKIIYILKHIYYIMPQNFNSIVLETIIWCRIKKLKIKYYSCYDVVFWTKDGKREGPYKYWYENQKIAEESNYKNGRLDGFYKTWFKDGQICESKWYKDGKWYIPINIPLLSPSQIKTYQET